MIFFDTETTGLVLPNVIDPDKQPRIIDLAMIQLDPFTGEETNRFETLLNPGCTLSAEITKITGYTDADLVGAPTFAEVLPYLIAFVLGENAWLAHNEEFDRKMLLFELMRVDAVTKFPWPPMQLDSVQMYAEEFGGRFPRLTALYERKLGRPLDQKHTAMADVEALVEIALVDQIYALGIPD